ncbi:S8 family serine peptidase [Pseudomaricurvus alcaniphilus]|uniref:S8 family serine peptidase n=1 Tax=Pseudomaricurvus alcaniphilus TaxID=1166482 RepID=UPI00140A5866|nr:S8 family serine peptidase [Pseudomaricurvus alcaniphilus]NHN37409.1 S8 family serine peptidase [Pseudomaricurvus alcaniphilus]
MKILAITVLLLIFTRLPAQAQLLGGGLLDGGRLPTGGIDGSLQRARKEAEKSTAAARDEVAKQQLPAAELAADSEAGALADTAGELAAGVQERLDKVLSARPIADLQGKVALTEVRLANGWRAVEREWLLLVDPDQWQGLQLAGVEVLELQRIDSLGLAVARLRVSPTIDSLAELEQRLPAAVVARLGRNHVYATQASTGASAPVNNPVNTPVSMPVNTAAAAANDGSLCAEPLELGMIDTAVNLQHPALAGAQVEQRAFLPESMGQPQAHGTAVAGLLAGSSAELQPLLPAVRLKAASVFYSRDAYEQGATLMHLVQALGWLAQQRLQVINMSLAGPPNVILQRTVESLAERNITLVAAVGNQGPAAPPLYPAAYPAVVGVTAVDGEQRIYRWANRGDQVDFAAPGVSIVTARSDGGIGRESGTSMATPVVAAHLACALSAAGGELSRAMAVLRGRATDLGEPGRDSVFGYGLLPR